MDKDFVFKQSASFGVGADKKQFKLGHHKVPEDVQKHDYFKKLVKAGLVLPAGSVDAPKPVMSLGEQQKAAIDKQKEDKAQEDEADSKKASSKKGKG